MISGRYPKSRLELLSAREHAHDPTGLRDDIHHRFDSRRALDHPATVAFSGMMIPAAAVVVIMVVWGPTIFWRHTAVRARWGHLKHGEARAARPMCDEGAARARLVPVLLCGMRSGERNGRRWCMFGMLRCVPRRRRRLLLRLLLGQCGENDARASRVSILCLPLSAADCAADPFGGRRRRRRHCSGVGDARGAGVLVERDLIPEDIRGVLLHTYAGISAHL